MDLLSRDGTGWGIPTMGIIYGEYYYGEYYYGEYYGIINIIIRIIKIIIILNISGII
jgi:hypothetical protein